MDTNVDTPPSKSSTSDNLEVEKELDVEVNEGEDLVESFSTN